MCLFDAEYGNINASGDNNRIMDNKKMSIKNAISILKQDVRILIELGAIEAAGGAVLPLIDALDSAIEPNPDQMRNDVLKTILSIRQVLYKAISERYNKTSEFFNAACKKLSTESLCSEVIEDLGRALSEITKGTDIEKFWR
jgi:lipopolysaccharide biosynthesis regulator YciM